MLRRSHSSLPPIFLYATEEVVRSEPSGHGQEVFALPCDLLCGHGSIVVDEDECFMDVILVENIVSAKRRQERCLGRDIGIDFLKKRLI